MRALHHEEASARRHEMAALLAGLQGIPDSMADGLLAQAFQDDAGLLSSCADDTGRIVALAWAVRPPKGGTHAKLGFIGVAADSRGVGIGMSVLSSLLDECRASGLDGLWFRADLSPGFWGGRAAIVPTVQGGTARLVPVSGGPVPPGYRFCCRSWSEGHAEG